MFIAALFTIAISGSSQDVPLLMNGLRKCGIYIQWNFFQPQRRMKFCHSQENEIENIILSEVRLRRPNVLPHLWITDIK
jgi:hypothetical protein